MADDSVAVETCFDNPLQQALDKLSHSHRPAEIDTTLCVFPLGRTDNQAPVLAQTKAHLEKLSTKFPHTHWLHIGVGGLYNFDLAAAGRHDAVLLADINPAHLRQMHKIVQTLATSDNRASFFGAMYEDPYMKIRISKLADMGWLKDEKSFSYLHALAKNGKIFTTHLDLYDQEHCRALKQWINNSGFTPATIYSSNILEHGLNHSQQPLSFGEITYMNELTRAQQNTMLHKKKAKTPYQSKILQDPAGALFKNLGGCPR